MNHKKGKKGVVFSLDSLVALLITGVIIGAAFFYLSQVQAITWSQPGLQNTNYDSLNLLHVDNTLKNAIESNDFTKPTSFLDNVFPSYACANMTFYDFESNKIEGIQTTGCAYPEDNSKSIFVARRVFIHDYDIYYVTMQSWYR